MAKAETAASMAAAASSKMAAKMAAWRQYHGISSVISARISGGGMEGSNNGIENNQRV